MDEKYIWPLVGVFLGWCLTVVSAGYNERRSKKQILGNLITRLIRVERQISTFNRAKDHLKKITDNWKSYEALRQRTIQKHFLEPSYVVEDLKKAIDSVSPLYPILAIEIEDLYHLLQKDKSGKLEATVKDESRYLYLLSIYEVGLEENEKMLQRLIRKLALKHSIYTFICLTISERRHKRNLKESEESMKQMIGKISDDLNSNSSVQDKEIL